MGRERLQSVIALIATLAVLAGRGAHAQISVLLDPSARAGGMGGAASAVAWGGTPDLWANPALVTAAPGFGLQATSEQLVPGLAGDVYLRTTRFTAAFAGLGVSSAGRPLGDIDLDYGVIDQRNIPWTGGIYYGGAERIWANGFGVSAATLADAVAGATGHRTRFADWGDVAWGRQWKRVRMDGYFGVPEAATYDDGWLVRLAPIDSRRRTSPSGGGVRVECSYAHALLDAGASERVAWFPFSGPTTLSLWRTRRDAGAVRIAWFGPVREDAPGGAWADVFRGGIGPLVDLTLACDHERVWLGADESRAPTNYVVSHYGAEATFVRALTARFGYVDDQSGEITKPTWGLGLCLPAGRHAEVRYDFASWPQSYPRRVYRHQVALRIDPLSRWFGLHGEPGAQNDTGGGR